MTLTERAEIVAVAGRDEESMSAFYAACAADPVFFINTCLWIFDPKATDGSGDKPFLLRRFQADYIRCLKRYIDSGEDLLTDKTREMGVTWMVLAVLTYYWLFDQTFTAIISSITEDKIEQRADPNCLFWKIDYMLDSLLWTVPFMYPSKFEKKAPSVAHMKRYNPGTRSSIIGEVMGPNVGRSGRARVMFLDEFAEAPFPMQSWASSSRTSDCRLPVFTPKGMNFAGRLANPARGQKRSIAKITLHWMLDESKNGYRLINDAGETVAEGHGVPPKSLLDNTVYTRLEYPWYEKAKRQLSDDPVLVAQELDVNYNESLEGPVYPQISKSRILKLNYDPSLALYLSMDYGLGDMTALIWWQWSVYDRRFKAIDSFKFNGKTIKWYIPFITGGDLGLGESEGGYSEQQIEKIESHAAYWGRYTDFFGDPAGKQRNQVTATSVLDVLSDHGIYVSTNDKARSFEARKAATAPMLPFVDFDEDNCAELVSDIQNSRQKPNGVPIHGPESHFRSSLEYFAVNQPHGLTGAEETELARLQHLSSPARVHGDPFSQIRAAREEIERQERIIESAIRETSGQRGAWGYSGRRGKK